MKSDSVKSTVSWRALLDEAIHNFSEAGLPEIEARWITEEAAGGQLIGVSFEELVTNRAMAHYDNLISRRLNGEPLQYVLGHWRCNPRCDIPLLFAISCHCATPSPLARPSVYRIQVNFVSPRSTNFQSFLQNKVHRDLISLPLMENPGQSGI